MQHPPMRPMDGEDQTIEDNRRSFEAMAKFVEQLGEFTPLIPDAVINNIMAQAGMFTSDPKVARILNIECQKFITELCSDLSREMTQKEIVQLDTVKRVLAKRGNRVDRPEFIVGPLQSTEEPTDLGDTDFLLGDPGFDFMDFRQSDA